MPILHWDLLLPCCGFFFADLVRMMHNILKARIGWWDGLRAKEDRIGCWDDLRAKEDLYLHDAMVGPRKYSAIQ